MGKDVQWYGVSGEMTRWNRWWYFVKSLWNPRQFRDLSEKIEEFQPDLIWSHTVLRAIGADGMRAVEDSGVPHMMMHHDLGLFASRPSQVQSVDDIPRNARLGAWWHVSGGVISCLVATLKWCIARRILSHIPPDTQHIFPSEWMESALKGYHLGHVHIFPHTVFPEGEDENVEK